MDEYIKITKPQKETREANNMKVIHVNVNGIQAKKYKMI